MFACIPFGRRVAWLTLLVTAASCALLQAQEPEKNGLLLWPEGAPGAVGDEELDRPRLSIHLPPADQATGTGVVVCPGGGYRVLAIDHEGLQVARWLNSFGVAAFVLKYRLKPRYEPSAALEDAQRAVRYVRFRADEFGVSPNRIGILGFSAGGHLVSAVGTHFDLGDASAGDPIRRQSCRPDFLVLAYPVISSALPKPAGYLSTDELVTPETPPAFLFHTSEDTGVPAEHSIRFYQALRKAGVPAELHIFRCGQHGLGLVPGDPATGIWPTLAANWMRASGFLTDAERVEISGRVTVDGQPLNRGWITFIPTDSAAKPVAWAYITHKMEGRFTIDAQHGPCVGPHRVEIRQVATDFLTTPSVDDVKLFTKHSARADTDLTYHVKPGQNTAYFDISTK